MRKKEQKLVITFQTTSEAMASEKILKELNIGERLIPLPGEISAGCGLAWKADVSERNKIEETLIKEKIKIGVFYEVYI